MSKPTRNLLKWIIGIAIGVVFIWLSALDWPLHSILAEPLSWQGTTVSAGDLWRFDWLYLIPYLLILVAIHYLRVIRWKPLLHPLGDVDFKTLNTISGIGFMYLFILPMRLGEFARPYMLSQHTNIGMSESMATIVVERIVDGLIVSVILLGVLLYMPDATVLTDEAARALLDIQLGAVMALGIFGGALMLLIVAYIARAWTIRMLRLTLGKLSGPLVNKIIGVIESFFQGLQVLPNGTSFLRFLAWSLIYWLLNGLGYYVLALGFTDLDIPLLAAYAMMCCVIVGMMLPNPPANVGVFWYFLLMPLTVYGVSTGQPSAIVFGLMAWMGQLVQQTGFGLWFHFRSRDWVPRSTSTDAEGSLVPDDAPVDQTLAPER